MKTGYFLRLSAIMMLVTFFASIHAKQIPVSGTNTDLEAALEAAEPGDELLISGWIMMNAPVTIEKNVTFIGDENEISGFDGDGASKLLEIAPLVENDNMLKFQNLFFVGGYNIDDGGIGRIVNGNTEFVKCFFEENVTTNRGGAFYIANPEDGSTATVTFKQCDFIGNLSNDRGGCIFVAGDAITNFEYCHIEGNSSSGEGETRGGAFFLEGGSHKFYYSVISGNTSGIPDGGGERGGAAFTTAGSIKSLTLESCAIVKNTAYGNHGSAFFLMGNPNVTLINTTIAGNTTMEGVGSWFLPTDNVDVTLVNVTMADNVGTNSGNAGGGIKVLNTGNRINIFNSILVRNISENGEGATDLIFENKTDITKTTVFKNSIIGLVGGVDAGLIPTATDNPNIPTKSKINMYSLGGEAAQPDYVEMDESGVNFTDGLQESSSFRMPYYTLKDGDAYAKSLGDPALLAEYDASTDLFLVERAKAADGSIYAGAVQAITGYEEFDDSGILSGIKDSPFASKDGIKISSFVSQNGLLYVDFGQLVGKAKGDLISLTGQVVKNVFDLYVIGKGVYALDGIAPGIYILQITIDGKSYSNKLVVR